MVFSVVIPALNEAGNIGPTVDAIRVTVDGSDSPDDLVRYYYPGLKLVVNRLANLFVRLLFRLHYNDVTNAFKAYRATVIQGCRPLLSPHFNLTVELPLKAIGRGYSYEIIPISWRQRERGVSALRLREMGSRYLFIVLYVWLERALTRGDYRRPAGEAFAPWSGGRDMTSPLAPRRDEGNG